MNGNGFPLRDQNDMAPDVFISYATKDKWAAELVCSRLEAGGILCWIAPRDIGAGRNWAEAIIESLNKSRIMVLIFSASSNESSQIKREIERAAAKRIHIIPLRIENATPTHAIEYFLANVHWLDANPPTDREIDRLAEIIRKELEAPPKQSEKWGWREWVRRQLEERHRIFTVAVIGLMLLFSGAGLWNLRVTETTISLDIDTGAVTMKLLRPWAWSPDALLDVNPVRLERLAGVDALVLSPSIVSPRGDAWIEIEGGKVFLNQLDLKPEAILTIDRQNAGYVDLYIYGGLSGQLTISGTAHLSAGAEATERERDVKVDLKIPESVTFQARGSAAVPGHFRFHPPGVWTIQDLIIQELRFARQIPGQPGEVTFLSSISGGHLILPELDQTMALNPKDRLSLEGLHGRIVELKVGNGIQVRFEGTAKKILRGPAGFEENLTPRYFKYILSQIRNFTAKVVQ